VTATVQLPAETVAAPLALAETLLAALPRPYPHLAQHLDGDAVAALVAWLDGMTKVRGEVGRERRAPRPRHEPLTALGCVAPPPLARQLAQCWAGHIGVRLVHLMLTPPSPLPALRTHPAAAVRTGIVSLYTALMCVHARAPPLPPHLGRR
jgi:hypothetical protein